MNISHIEEHSFIYGPNCRFVIWTQGCSIRCNGCWNTEMWSFDKKTILTIDELLRKIDNERDLVEGITILGGEPLDQYSEVTELLEKSKTKGLSTMLFTGYDIIEIEENRMASILKNTDILITGRYDKTKRTLNHQWIGSTNQEIHYLTNRYNENSIINANYVEITLNENGSTDILGFLDRNFLKTIQ